MKEEITNVINKLLKPDNFKYYANYGYAYPLLAIDADTIIEFIEKLEQKNKSLQSQLKAKEEVIKEVRETIKTKLQKSFAYDYGLSGVDATGKDRLFTETVIELQLIDKILSKGENKWQIKDL